MRSRPSLQSRRHAIQRFTVGLLTSAVFALAAHAQDGTVKFSIGPQPLTSGLLQLGRQANISIAASRTLTAGKHGKLVEGEMDVQTALTRLLDASGLAFEFVTPTFVRVVPATGPTQNAVRTPASAAVRDDSSMDEITVTARRRLEPLQRVPISVAVLQGDDVANWNLNDMEDIARRIPVLQFRPNTLHKDRLLLIRGIGTFSTSQSPDPSIATVIDGVVLARSGQAAADLLDVDQIEVLSGPQGTLFGKNASAGVVNVTTQAPGDQLSGLVRASYYEGNEYRIVGSLSGPLSDRVGARVHAFAGQFDGNMRNLYDGRRMNGYRHQGVRSKVVATPTEDLTLTLAADFSRSFENMPSGAFTSSSQIAYCPRHIVQSPAANSCDVGEVQPNPFFAAVLNSLGIEPSSNNRQVSQNAGNNTHDRNGGTSLQADWNLGGGFRLTSISAWRRWQNSVDEYDYDQLSAFDAIVPQITDHGIVDLTQTSQELRVVSPEGGPVDFVAGLYYMHIASDETYGRDVLRGSTVPGAPPVHDFGLNHFGSRNDNYSIFGEANFHFTPRLHALLGYRQTWDRVGYYTDRVSTSTASNPVPGVAPSYAGHGSRSVAGWSGRVGLLYDLTPDVMTYATLSRGYKGPAYSLFFNMEPANTAPIDPETSTAYEVGTKAQLWNHRLRINAAAFRTEFHDYQSNAPQLIDGAYVNNLTNAGTVTNRGVELSVGMKPVEHLTWQMAALYNDAVVRTWRCDFVAASCNLTGNRLPYSPRWTLNLSQDYVHPIRPGLDMSFGLVYRYQSTVTFQYTNTADQNQPAFGVWDVSLELADERKAWSTRLIVKNLLNQDYSSFMTLGDLAGVTRAVPRDAGRYMGLMIQKEF